MTSAVARSARLSKALAALLALCAMQTTPLAQTNDQLGRLFFTPEKRQWLDRQRDLNIQVQQETTEAPTLTINGMVTRSSGKQTVWLNDVPQHDRNTTAGVSVRQDKKHPGHVVVHQPDSPQTGAKIGTSINRSTGTATDVLGGGHIARKIAPAL